MRDGLREALVDSELFLHQVLPLRYGMSTLPLSPVSTLPSITFTLEDTLVKNLDHDRLLSYMGYIRSTKVERILIGPGSALRVRLLYFFHISFRKLPSTTTVIYGFNIQSSRSMENINGKLTILK